MNRQKFKQLVLYLASRSLGDLAFGAVKLNKLLYYCDFRAFALFGQSITGTVYEKRQFGPVPRHVTSIINELVLHRDATVQWMDYHGYSQQRVLPQIGPDTTVFSSGERNVIDALLSDFAGLNATQMSARSHEEMGWRVALEGEVIPYQTAFLSDEPLTEDDIKRGQEFAREHPEAI
ncbi:MAG: SocA family protein [Chloroflexi bacterium]|nr:SocA family protein [Chloroflexota bacterium]